MRLTIAPDARCWYELAWQPAPLGVVIRLDASVAHWLERIPEADVQACAEEHGACCFVSNSMHFGYKRRTLLREQHTLFAPFPQTHIGDRTCTGCNGTKKKRWNERDEKCFNCNGTGRIPAHDLAHADALAASLALLFRMLLQPPEGLPASHPPQLMNTSMGRQLDRGWINGFFSDTLVSWLLAQPERSPATITSALLATWVHLCGPPNYADTMHARSYIKNGFFSASCSHHDRGPMQEPTNAFLSPEVRYEVIKGYQLGAWYCQTSVQQLTLLAGLASLHDLARSDMQKPPS